MTMTARQLTLATLDRQMLLERTVIDVETAVRRLVAIQAQEPASPFVALWNRVADFDAGDLSAAFRSLRIVKSPLVRITLHAVAADDYTAFHRAVTPILRAARLNDERFRGAGLTPADADAAVAGLLEFARRPRSRDEVLDHLADGRTEPPDSRLFWALRTYAPLLRAPTHHPWDFDSAEAAYLAGPAGDDVDPEAAVDELVVRYLHAFGPASARDLAQFTMLPMSTLRPSLLRLADRLVEVAGPGGSVLHDPLDARPIPPEDLPVPPRLLGMWDNVLLAYRDRTRVIPDDHRRHVIRRNGDVLPAVLVDGSVAGVWRTTRTGIEVCGFGPFDADVLDRLDLEAQALRQFLVAREKRTYGRYERWWSSLPTEHRRVIGETS